MLKVVVNEAVLQLISCQIIDQTNYPAYKEDEIMTHQNIKQNQDSQINAPFRAKSAGISAVALLAIGMYYFANVLPMLPANEGIPDGAITLIITAVVLIVIVESVLQTVLFIGAGNIETPTEQDTRVNSMSKRNAYSILVVGVMLTFGSMLLGFSSFAMANVLMLCFLLSEIVRLVSVVFYYQRLV